VNAPGTSIFVYYRVRAPTIASGAVDRVFAQVLERTGIPGRLLQGSDDPLLWMEIYEGVIAVEEFERTLADCVASTGLEHAIAPGSARNIERFRQPCA
jgi:hypothetical protein